MPSLRPFTPLDRLLFGRALALCLALAALALLIAAATDEPGSRLADRACRLSALSPVLGALAVALVRGQLARRGELLALAASGFSPLGALRGALLSAPALGVSLGLWLAVGAGPLGALFPAPEPSPFRLAGSVFLAPERGVALEAPGFAARFFEPEPAAPRPLPRLPLGLAVALGAVLAPLWAALPAGRAARAAVGSLAITAVLVALHAAAAGASGLWLLAPPALLAAHALALARS